MKTLAAKLDKNSHTDDKRITPWQAVDQCWNHQSLNTCPHTPVETKNNVTGLNNYTFPGLSLPKCTAKFEINLEKCTTCCCKGGLLTANIRSSLVVEHNQNCAQWFTMFADPLMRLTVSVIKAMQTALFLGDTCYMRKYCLKHVCNKKFQDKDFAKECEAYIQHFTHNDKGENGVTLNMKGKKHCKKLKGAEASSSDLGEGVGGRRGGASYSATGGFTLSAGSNRAGNDEALL